ncbi:MAG: ribosome-associated translation inhibitor RaiA [Chloroflexi bacterium]|nr:ribosome-associated translation inhibitor RaiA [Chloroflexota bacterium]
MAVKVEVIGRNLEITERIRDYVNKKMGRLDRFLADIDEARVELAFVKSARSAMDRQVAQITVRGRRFLLRTEERADDVFAAFDNAIDKMQRQIERYKGKRGRGRGDGRSASEVAEVSPEESGTAVEPIIARRKTFEMLPMTELEALEQMKLLAHDNFFIFFNVEANAINVLYRRRDGAYGLIEPRVG